MLATTVVSIFDVPALLFHVTMLCFLLRQMAKGNKHYTSSFYVLFAVVSSMDIVFMILVSMCNVKKIGVSSILIRVVPVAGLGTFVRRPKPNVQQKLSK